MLASLVRQMLILLLGEMQQPRPLHPLYPKVLHMCLLMHPNLCLVKTGPLALALVAVQTTGGRLTTGSLALSVSYLVSPRMLAGIFLSTSNTVANAPVSVILTALMTLVQFLLLVLLDLALVGVVLPTCV